MTLPVLRGMIALVAAIAAGTSLASSVWFSDGATVNRYARHTGVLNTSPGIASVSALAAGSASGAWIVRGDRLQRLNDDLATVVDVALPSFTTHASPVLAADPDGVSVWLALGNVVSRYADDGSPMGQWTHDEAVTDVVVGGPGAVWIASARGIVQYDAAGTPLRAWVPPASTVMSAPTLLFDRGGGYLWAIGSNEAVQIDVLRGMSARTSLALPTSAHAVGIDVADGVLWVLSGQGATLFDRDARMSAVVPMPALELHPPFMLAPETGVPIAWTGDRSGVSLLNAQSLQWIRLVQGGPTRHVAVAHPWLRPVLAVEQRWPEMRLRHAPACQVPPCAIDARHRDSMRLRASVDGIDVSEAFRSEPAAVMTAATAELSAIGGNLAAMVVDAWGLASETITVDLVEATNAGRGMRREANALPTAAITTPANNSTYVAAATIAIGATATDSDGSIAKVEFLRDGVLLYTDTSSPYAYTWSNVAAGTYKLSARAFDNAGGSTTSVPVTVQVKANVAPTAKLTAPVNNSAYTAPATISLAATATDSDGSVAKVEMFAGSTRLATLTKAPYTHVWANVAAGSHVLTVKATDDKGAVTTSAGVTVKINNPPTAKVSAPANGAKFVAPATIVIQASATDSDGTVAKVEFFGNGALLGRDATSPYTYSWVNPPLGTHALTVRSTDNQGAVTTSPVVTVTVGANIATRGGDHCTCQWRKVDFRYAGDDHRVGERCGRKREEGRVLRP